MSFFQCLTHEQLTPVTEDIDDEETRVFLWIVVLLGIQRSRSRGGSPTGWQRNQIEDLAAGARTAIERLPQAGRLTWLLDWIDAVTPESPEVSASSPPPALPLAVPRAELKRLAAFLKRAAYAAPPDQVARFFDLVAVLSPRDLDPWLADAVIASHAGPELLWFLARNSRHETVLETLFEQANRYLLGFALSTDETAKLWNVLLTQLATRLCVMSARRGERSGSVGNAVERPPAGSGSPAGASRHDPRRVLGQGPEVSTGELDDGSAAGAGARALCGTCRRARSRRPAAAPGGSRRASTRRRQTARPVRCSFAMEPALVAEFACRRAQARGAEP